MCVKIHRSFFSAHEIDHPSNISMNRTVEQLAENSAKKKEPFKNLNEAPKPTVGLLFRALSKVRYV